MMNRKSVVEAKNINRYSVITQTTSFDHVIMARPAGDAMHTFAHINRWLSEQLSDFTVLIYFPTSKLFSTSLSLDFCTQLLWGACGKVSHG